MKLDAPFLDSAAFQAVTQMLTAKGHQALAVGGAVRNALLGRAISDVDIATDARPEEVISLAKAAGMKPVPTGVEHGTVTVVAHQEAFEITTFRRDLDTDGRHATVAFSGDVAEDAARRDFTMNALYATPDGAVLDPIGGLPDLLAGRLRFVGDPATRIAEDYLRIVRFFRFHAWYGKEADPAALGAIAATRDGLHRISAERIGAELRKLLAAPDPAASVALMERCGVLDTLLSGATAAPLAALIRAEQGAEPDWMRRLAALDPPDDAADRLRLSRGESRRLGEIRNSLSELSLDALGYQLGRDVATDVALVQAARGRDLPAGWRGQIAQAADAKLPIKPADLAETLSGRQLGIGLRAAERLWIESGFSAPAPALIDAAILAGADDA